MRVIRDIYSADDEKLQHKEHAERGEIKSEDKAVVRGEIAPGDKN